MSYGLRKSLIFTNQKKEMKDEIEALKTYNKNLEEEVSNISKEIEETQDRNEKNDISDKKKHEEEVQNIKKKNMRLKEELEKRLSIETQ